MGGGGWACGEEGHMRSGRGRSISVGEEGMRSGRCEGGGAYEEWEV